MSLSLGSPLCLYSKAIVPSVVGLCPKSVLHRSARRRARPTVGPICFRPAPTRCIHTRTSPLRTSTTRWPAAGWTGAARHRPECAVRGSRRQRQRGPAATYVKRERPTSGATPIAGAPAAGRQRHVRRPHAPPAARSVPSWSRATGGRARRALAAGM
eukprot:scaffold14805_cov121-Isochrysis_galbana.AAC.6